MREDRHLERPLLGSRRRYVDAACHVYERPCEEAKNNRRLWIGWPGLLCSAAGKRCIVKNCMRQAYERTNNFCNSHFQEWQQGVRDMEIDDDDDIELADAEETKTHELHL